MPASTAPLPSAWRRFEWYDVAPVHAPSSALIPAHAGVKDVLCVAPTPLRPSLDAVVHPPAAANACATALAAKQAGIASADSFDPHAPPLAAAAASWPARAALGARGMLACAYASGRIALLVPGSYQQILSFDAFGDGIGGRVTHISLDAVGRLVALGEQVGVRFPLLRIWDLRQIVAEVVTTDDSDEDDGPLRPEDARTHPRHQTTRANLHPRLLAETRVQHGSRPTPVAALSHTPDLAFLSVGLADGTVLLLRGLSDALAEVENVQPSKRTGNGKASDKAKWDENEPPLPLAQLPKFKVIMQQPSRANEAPLEPLTALALSVVRDTEFDGRSKAAPEPAKGAYLARDKKKNKATSISPAAVVYMYIVTPTKLLRYLVQAPAGASYGRPTIVDDVGTALGCVALLPTALNALSLLPPSGDFRPLIPPRTGISEAQVSSNVASETMLRDTARAWRARIGLAGKLVLARDEALYIAGGEGREACYALEGPKVASLLTCDPNVLYRISDSALAGAAAATQHLVVWGPPKGAAGQESALLHIFDLEAQAVALTHRVPGGVRAAWVESAADPAAGEVKICVLSNTGSVLRLTQRSLRARINDLVRLAMAPSIPASLGLPSSDAPGPGGEFATALSTTRAYFLSLLQGGPGPFGEGDRAPRVTVHNDRAAHATLSRALDAAVPLISSLHAQYADSLYSRGEFDAATAQWFKAVGAVRPSLVIRKLLDSQRISNLATYLAALHSQGLATPEHTTLLLNCYAKVKDVAALDAFIRAPARAAARAIRASKAHKSESKSISNGDGLFSPLPEVDEVQEGDTAQGARERERETLPFDLATAIRVCRQGGFYAQAGYLAARYGDAGEYMRIQVNDLEDWDAALVYVRRSSPSQAGELLQSHARVLLLHRPMPATTLLVELCAGHFVPGVLPLDAGDMPAPDETVDDLDLSEPALAPPLPPDSQSTGLMSYLQLTSYLRARKMEPTPGPAPPASEAEEPPSEDESSRPAEAAQSPYPPPSPQTFFAHFAGMQDEFALFLESVALLRWGQQVDMVSDPPAEVEGGASLAPSHSSELGDDAQAQEAVWNTLLELYLSDAGEVKGLDLVPTGRRARALRLLQQFETLPYDVAQALLLCTTANFIPGLVLLYARLGLWDDLIHLFLHLSDRLEGDEADEAHAQLMKALDKWGGKAPHLYPLVLRHLVSSPALLSKRSEDVAHILTIVEARSLLSPAEVVQLLAGPEEGGAGIGLVRSYLVRSLTAAQDAAAADTTLLRSYVAETRSKEQAAVSLTSSDSPAVLQATTCSICSAPLSLPSTHFLCKHAYHSTCLATAQGDGEEATECPLCAQAAGVNAQIRRANLKAAKAPQVLLDQVAKADDGLAATARLFGMGLLGLEPPTA